MSRFEAAHVLAITGLGLTTGMSVGLFLPGVTRFESEQVDEWIGGFVAIAPAFLLGTIGAVWSLMQDREMSAVSPWWWGAFIACIAVLGLNFAWFVPTNWAVLYAERKPNIDRTRRIWIALHIVRMGLLLAAFVAAAHATVIATHERASSSGE